MCAERPDIGIEDNKRVVQAFMDLFERAAIADALAMMTDDAAWEVVGKPHLYGGAGVQSKAQMAHIWPALYAKLDGGLQMRVTGMIAERELVAAEVRSDATTITGKRYQNDYHFLITVRDGRIARIKEYTDLMHAAEVFD
jgi:ketosteroid isomerase-like protein